MRLIAIVMGWGTYPIFCLKDGFGGYSPGKKLMGLQALDLESGKPVSFAQSFKRNLPTIIPLIPLVMAFQISTGQRWGDRWAKTTVVWKKYDESPVFLHRLKKSELIDNLTK